MRPSGWGLWVVFAWVFGTSFSGTAWALQNAVPALDDADQSSVWIGAEAVEQDGSHVTGYCNATLLSPTLIVTAAHCVAQTWFMGSKKVKVAIGKYHYITKPDGNVVRIGYENYFDQELPANITVNPRVEEALKSHGINVVIKPQIDQAIIDLQSPLNLPEEFPYRKLVAHDRALAIAKQISSYAPEVLTINPIAEIRTNDTKRVGKLDSLTWQASGNSFKSKSKVALDEGDSGAGLLVTVDGELELLGFAGGHGSGIFGGWDAYALGAGPLCDIAKNAHFGASELAILCR